MCIDDDYEKYLPPSDGSKKVYSTIETHRVRDVDAKKKTLSIDFILTMRWLDSRIKANFTKYDNKSGEVILGPAAVEKIWSPGVYVFNRQSFKFKEEWASLITARILTTKEINHLDGKSSNSYELSIPTVQMKYEVKTAVYCMGWSYMEYPMDNQTCNVTIGSASGSSIFTLYQVTGSSNPLNTYKAANFNITVDFFEYSNNHINSSVGIKLTMSRLRTSFLLKYYFPCAAIVLVSEIGFAIPITAIPGRVGLLVTLFLTLVNLLIHQMVKMFFFKKCKVPIRFIYISLG